MNLKDIGLTIKNLRTSSKMSQDDLANKLFVSRQAISNWECGKTYPDIDNLKRLSDIFKIPIEDVIRGNNKEKNIFEKLYVEIIKTKNKNRRLFNTIILLTVIILLSIVTCFFIDNYKTTRIYRVDSKNHMIVDGLFVVTNDSWYLKFGNFISEKKIKNVKVFLMINNKEELICEGLSPYDSYTLKETVDYNELFRFSEKETINNLYLEITYEDETIEITKADFELTYENSRIFRKREQPISDNKEIKVPEENIELRENIKNNFNKITDRKYQYEYIYDNKNYIASYIDEPNRLEITDENNNFRLTIQLNIFNGIIYQTADNRIRCYVKTNSIKPQNIGDCNQELENKIINIYQSFELEMNK